jgi:hypothetical protein
MLDLICCKLMMPNQKLPLRPDEIIVPIFMPVPMRRNRHDGWTPERQKAFLLALTATGSVAASARMVGLTRKSAYQLRKRADAESFADAWEAAISSGRARIFEYMFDRAVNGVTTFRLRLGGAVDISHGLDGQLVAAQLREPMQHPYGDAGCWERR